VATLREDLARLLDTRPAPSLARVALEIARLGHPDLDPSASLAMLDALANGVRGQIPGPVASEQAIRAVLARLFTVEGFHGNTADYYDPRNSFLNEVLDRRTGIPITLAVVVIEVGTRLGLPVTGVGFPGHFLVRFETPTAPRFVDPFSGTLLDDAALAERVHRVREANDGVVPQNLLAPTSVPSMLTRMLHNLLRIYLDRNDPPQALATIDLLGLFTPDAPDLIRTRGLILARLDCATAAIADLRRYLALAPDAGDAEVIRTELTRLAGSASTVH